MKTASWILWPLVVLVFALSTYIAYGAATIWGSWTGYPLLFRLSGFAYFLLCNGLIIRVGTAASSKQKLAFQLAMISTAPLMLGLILWVNS